MNHKQTKRRQHTESVAARIIPEVLVPRRRPIKLTATLSFSSCSQPYGSKMTHPRHTQQTMSSLGLRLGNPLCTFIGQEIKYTFSTPHPSFNPTRKHFLPCGLSSASLSHFSSHAGMPGQFLCPRYILTPSRMRGGE